MEDGLTSNFVRKIIEDEQGFIWIATVNGLNRFDGNEFKIYKHDKTDPTSISNNNLYDLLIDNEGYMWVASLRGGLNRYDPRTETFMRFQYDPNDTTSISSDEVISLFQDKKGTIWVGTSKALNKVIKDQSGKISFQRINSKESDPGGKIRSIYAINEDNRGNLWLGGTVGIIRYNPLTGVFRNYHWWPNLPSKPYPNGIPNQIICDHDGNLWVALQPGGVEKISFKEEPESDSITVTFSRTTTLHYPENLEANRIRSLLLDKENRLWIGSRFGLYLATDLSRPDIQTSFRFNPDKEGYISSDVVWTMFEDRAGNIWTGGPRGLSMLPAHEYPFHIMRHDPEDPMSLPSSIVGSLLKDTIGNIWISTQKGVVKMNQQTGDFHHFTFPDQIIGSVVGGMALDQKNRVYMADYGAISRADDPAKNELTHFMINEKDPTTLGTNKTYSVFIDQDNRPWVTAYKGLISINPANDSIELCPFDSANGFTQVIALGPDSLWAGSQLGLMAFDKKTRTYHKQFLGPGYENEVITLIHPSNDSSFTLWLGTQTGLHKFKRGKGIIKSYSENDGLCDVFMRCWEFDLEGNIWLGTGKGLSRFNIKEESFFNYYEKDGIPNNYFIKRSTYQDATGEIFMGTADGLLSFYPKDIKPNSYIPPVQITGFRLFNDPVLVGKTDPQITSHKFSLEKSIAYTEDLSLKYNQRILTFEFAALNYQLPQNNQLAYKMDGFDDDWIQARPGQRQATYTNLDPGTYTFRVKGSNNDGLWNEEGTSILLTISPPWYRSTLAYIVYVLLAGLLIWAIIRYRTEKIRQELETRARIEKAKTEEREKVRARSSRDFHDEAGNKITKISLYTGLLKQQMGENPQASEFLDRVEDNIKELSSGMRDFIWVLDPKHDSLEDTLLRIRQFGDKLFEHSGIDFQFNDSIQESNALKLDLNTRRHLLMIFKEAMNNTMKYAQASTVKLQAGIRDNRLEITLNDDGLGFDPNNLSRVNGLENMKSRAEESGGNLEIKGVPGLGTSVIFSQEV